NANDDQNTSSFATFFSSGLKLVNLELKRLAADGIDRLMGAAALSVKTIGEVRCSMRFRQFMEPRCWLLIGGLVSILWSGRPALAAVAKTGGEDFDILIRGGSIYDGSGNPPRRADVGIKGDRIAAVGDLAKAT